MTARRSDTKDRIQQVALELFIEQGYDKTSLREIAERLDVTKAALYYHFKSKADIVTKLVEDMRATAEEIVEWAGAQPRTPEGRAEIVRRIPTLIEEWMPLLNFTQVNQASLRDHPRAEEIGGNMLMLLTLLTDAEEDPASQIKGVLAIAALLLGRMPLPVPIIKASDADRQAAAMEVALQLVSGQSQSV